MDNFEQHIKENRKLLDSIEQPELDVIWSGIESKMQTTNGWTLNIGYNWKWSIAAAIILIVIAMNVLPLMPSTTSQPSQEIELASIFPELANEESKYKQLVSQKEEELNLQNLNPEEFAHIFSELNLLDNIYKETLQEISQNIPNDQMVNILIKFYEQKIRVLERLSNEIEKRTRHEALNNERSI